MQLPSKRSTSARRAKRLAVAAILATAVTRVAGAQAPPPPLEESGIAASNLRDSIVSLARAQIGKRYRHGGASPRRGFDCSGLVEFVFAGVDLSLPRTAKQQATFGVALDRDTSQLRPGDLLTFSTRERGIVSHIGIYVGGGHFVHASSVAGRVIESPVNRPPAPRIKVWKGVRRIPFSGEPADAPAGAILAPER